MTEIISKIDYSARLLDIDINSSNMVHHVRKYIRFQIATAYYFLPRDNLPSKLYH